MRLSQSCLGLLPVFIALTAFSPVAPAAGVRPAVDIKAGNTIDLNISSNDDLQSLLGLARQIAGDCLSEASVLSFSTELFNRYQNPAITAYRYDRSRVIEDQTVRSGAQSTFSGLVFGGQEYSAYYQSPSNPQNNDSLELISEAYNATDPENPATLYSVLRSSEVAVYENFYISTPLPAFKVVATTEEVCGVNNFGRESCKTVPVGSPTVQLVIGKAFVDTAIWTNQRSQKPTKKTLDLNSYAKCMFWKWTDVRP